MAKSLKLVIFDCDGTLVDSQHMICTAMSGAYAAHGLPVPERETMLSIVGLSLPRPSRNSAGAPHSSRLQVSPSTTSSPSMRCASRVAHRAALSRRARSRGGARDRARRRARHRDGKIAARCAARARPSWPARSLHHHPDRGRCALEARSRHGRRGDARSRRRRRRTRSWSATRCTTSRWRMPRARRRSA